MIKKILVLALILALSGISVASDDDTEKTTVIKVIEEAYLNGVFNIGDPHAMKKFFHEDFILRGFREGKLAVLSIAEWIKIIIKNKSEGKYPPEVKIRFEYPLVDITVTTAVVKINVFRGDKQIFTDYLFLLKFPDGWKITDKIFEIQHLHTAIRLPGFKGPLPGSETAWHDAV